MHYFTLTIIPAFLIDIWNGFKTIPFFDFGFSFDKVIIGIIVVNVSFIILNRSFSLGSSIKANIGRNARHKRNIKNKEVQE